MHAWSKKGRQYSCCVCASSTPALPRTRHAGENTNGRVGPALHDFNSANTFTRAVVTVPRGTYVFTLWLSVLCMRSKAWLAALAYSDMLRPQQLFKLK